MKAQKAVIRISTHLLEAPKQDPVTSNSLAASTSSPPTPPSTTMTTTVAAAAAAKSGERKSNEKTHNKGHILDRQIKHASKSGASDQISQWMVKIWTVRIRQQLPARILDGPDHTKGNKENSCSSKSINQVYSKVK